MGRWWGEGGGRADEYPAARERENGTDLFVFFPGGSIDRWLRGFTTERGVRR